MKKYKINNVVLCNVRFTNIIEADSLQEALIKLGSNYSSNFDFDDNENYEIIEEKEIIKTIVEEVKK